MEIIEFKLLGKKNYRLVPDRAEAIREAINSAREGDMVIIAGKGHETYQVFKNVTLPFDDREVVRKILKERGSCLQSEMS